MLEALVHPLDVSIKVDLTVCGHVPRQGPYGREQHEGPNGSRGAAPALITGPLGGGGGGRIPESRRGVASPVTMWGPQARLCNN